MESAENSIRAADCKEAYPFELDVAQYKQDFATLMAVLEEAAAKAEVIDTEQEEVKESRDTVWMALKRFLKTRVASTAGNAAAAAALTIRSTGAFEAARKGGFLR